MTNEQSSEEGGFDVDAFVDDGIEKAGEGLQKQLEEEGSILNPEDNPDIKIETEEVAAETVTEKVDTETKAETDTAAESTKETDSTISQLISGDHAEQEQTQGRVPLEKHTKLRERAQRAEAERDELKSQLAGTQTAGDETAGETKDPLAGLAGDDLVRVDQVSQAIDTKVEQAVSKINQEAETARATQAAQQQAVKVVESETAFKADTADYNDVTTKANTLNLITNADRTAIFADDNPAKKYYEVSKQKLTAIQTALGIAPKSSTSEQTTTTEKKAGGEEDEEMSDDEILEEIY